MNISLLSNFFMDIKNWIYGWDELTFTLITIIIVLLMAVSAISFIKAILGEGTKFKVMQVIFLGLLTAMLVWILVIRL